MHMLTVCKTFHFEAAHQLPYHDGKCKYMHGHSYKVELCVRGIVQPDEPTNNEAGMVVDFSVLSTWWKTLDARYGLDHITVLNGILENPTAENICLFIVYQFEQRKIKGVTLTRVRVHETADSYVEWNADDQHLTTTT